MLTPQEVKRALGRLTLIVDTREQDTKAFRKRLDLIGFPHTRQKLDFGDYSATTALDDGT
jgi:ERCC4-type nuclease